MTQRFYDELAHEWDAFRARHHHGHYHPDNAPPAPGDTMSLATLEADAEQLLIHAQDFARNKLPAALADAKKLEPVVTPALADALGAAAHVPPSEIEALLVPTINWLASRYPKPDQAAAADPAMGEQQPAA